MIVGLFADAATAPVTQASELAKLLRQNGYPVQTVSRHRNKFIRLADIVYTLFAKAGRYDIAIVQFYSGNSFIWQSIAARIIKRLNKKLVFTIHGGGVPAAIEAEPQKYLQVIKLADAITVPSAYIGKVLGNYSIPCNLIENTIQLNNYPFYNKQALRPALLWMRSFGSIYNPLMAVRVVAELKSAYPQVHLYMGGIDMGQLQETRDLVKDLGLTGNITIAGFMNFEQKKHYAELCDIYMSTNNIDNAPVTFTEMWAMGLPVVSTNVGGVPELINDGIDGLLVPADDHIVMAEKIAALIENTTLAQSLIAHGRERVAAYDEHTVYHKWDKLLTGL